jgi:hypothetical protein
VKLHSSEKTIFKLVLAVILVAGVFYRVKYGSQSEVVKKRLERIKLEKNLYK